MSSRPFGPQRPNDPSARGIAAAVAARCGAAGATGASSHRRREDANECSWGRSLCTSGCTASSSTSAALDVSLERSVGRLAGPFVAPRPKLTRELGSTGGGIGSVRAGSQLAAALRDASSDVRSPLPRAPMTVSRLANRGGRYQLRPTGAGPLIAAWHRQGRPSSLRVLGGFRVHYVLERVG